MKWRRATIAATCLVLAAIACPFPAWASATTGVTSIAAEDDHQEEGQPPTEKNNDESRSDQTEAPQGSLEKPFPATGDAAGVVFAFVFALFLIAAFVAAKQHRARSRGRMRMHVIDEQSMRGMKHALHKRGRRP